MFSHPNAILKHPNFSDTFLIQKNQFKTMFLPVFTSANKIKNFLIFKKTQFYKIYIFLYILIFNMIWDIKYKMKMNFI